MSFVADAVPGYHGGYRRIDLATARSETVPLPESVLRAFLGGSGLGTYLLLQERAATCDAYDPQAPIAFVFSPLVGSPLTTSAKFAVVAKSPLTNQLNDALASSGFAIAGKRTGCDALVLIGKCAEPSIVVVDDQQVAVQPAGDLWGMEVPQAEEALRQRLGAEFACAVIGPAGERRVRFATVSHDGRHAGRGGHGAVLGSKNVKAIAVRGSAQTRWADPAGLNAIAKDLSRRSFGPATAKYRELGTAANLLVFNRLGVLPTRNFQEGRFEGVERLSPEQMRVSREKMQASCVACTIGCEHIYGVRASDVEPVGKGVRVEYENLFALGPLCGVQDPDTVLAASQRCDQLGIDTISAGATIAFAMECVQRGLLEEAWLRFGDGAALLRAVNQIGARQGLGQQLADGSRRMATQIGQEALKFAPQVKGLEIPGYEPRGLQTVALGFAVGTRGADHNRSSAYEVDFSARVDRRRLTPNDVALAVASEDRAALLDSLILCKFLRGVFVDVYEEAAGMLKQVTGWDLTGSELRETAARIVTAKKLFNIRAGWRPEEDTLPARFLEQPLEGDPRAVLTATR
ncbi:MAG: aldehyde:ferredoxin oxidoreductase, partial [Planctomycetales bacterium]|nr:aldehyde:ferredoxin oxidoreductase [Planctomycetales bacterium]NIM08082.1 aldehyde:ferredoxin oxidoreductase [Planctomycetales bacterium]NIN07573.1 aldehyde:ferredoxin oxidoreductase [Planctomycetales bacterium]NIN76684.1 aldehyde:ferredoxin oxidoreductase [Planctomycetales bacterium]NIO33872.1 aldehyde:ferredoxin oxidoreductase [Planctomycetales bacterium]